MGEPVREWGEFEPVTEREQLAFSLMVAGVCIPADEGGVHLDFALADAVLEDLHDRGQAILAALPPDSRAERLEVALREIDALPAGHYRRNGFATADPWVRQRDVRRIVRRALADAPAKAAPVQEDSHE